MRRDQVVDKRSNIIEYPQFLIKSLNVLDLFVNLGAWIQ